MKSVAPLPGVDGDLGAIHRDRRTLGCSSRDRRSRRRHCVAPLRQMQCDRNERCCGRGLACAAGRGGAGRAGTTATASGERRCHHQRCAEQRGATTDLPYGNSPCFADPGRLVHSIFRNRGVQRRLLFQVAAPRPARPQTPIATYLVSKYSPIPSNPPSRPKPDCLTPPKGAAGFDTTPWFNPTMPVSIPSLTRKARSRSRV